MSHTPYATRRQRVPSVQDEVTANISEYAAMNGKTFDEAFFYAYRNYAKMLAEIHRIRRAL